MATPRDLNIIKIFGDLPLIWSSLQGTHIREFCPNQGAGLASQAFWEQALQASS
ncbi:MAG: hypothetical protein F6J95_009180 [Leptolyngbya sp. SIO1E4]|nr:hypothetical protein [Leptolyngbya sp. SIO1E4]